MLDRADNHSTRFHMRQQVLNAVRLGADNQNSDATPRHILLELDASIERQEDIKTGAFGERKKDSILFARQTCFWRSHTVMLGEFVFQPARNTFVKQDLHPN